MIPNGIDDIRATYGDIKVERVNGQMVIVAPDDWEARNMILVRDLPGFSPRRLYINRAIEIPLRTALAAAQLVCPEYLIRTMGCFNPRPKRVNPSELSGHAWGVAVDINADTNPMGHPLRADMSPEFIDAFTGAGFVWGGKFPTPDPMHFQLFAGF